MVGWVWKYDIISQALNKVNKDDLVVYCDSGTSFNFYAKNRFYEYIEMLNDSNYSNFRIVPKNTGPQKNFLITSLLK